LTASIILVHGAANSRGVWRFWRERLAARGLAEPPIVIGWNAGAGSPR
jgi:hypothetical protein